MKYDSPGYSSTYMDSMRYYARSIMTNYKNIHIVERTNHLLKDINTPKCVDLRSVLSRAAREVAQDRLRVSADWEVYQRVTPVLLDKLDLPLEELDAFWSGKPSSRWAFVKAVMVKQPSPKSPCA